MKWPWKRETRNASLDPSWAALIDQGALSASGQFVDSKSAESIATVHAAVNLIAGTVAIFWTFCLWLIPMLIGAGFWRHVRHRVPLAYVPTLWSIVFPVGMFAVASINLGRVDRLPIVEGIGTATVVVAAAVWLVVFAAMIRHYVRSAMGRGPVAASGSQSTMGGVGS